MDSTDGPRDDRLECFLALVAPASPQLQCLSLGQRKAAYFYSLGYNRHQVADLLGVQVDAVTNAASKAKARILSL